MSKRSLTILTVAALLVSLTFLLRHAFGVREQTLVVATLVRTSGSNVMRDFAAQPFAWSQAPIGARFGLGDGLHTGSDDSAELKLLDNSALSVRPNTTLRFLTDGQDEQAVNLDLERGEAVVQAGSRDLSLRTHVGTAIVKAGSTVTLDRDGRELGLSVQLGSLRFTDAEGSQRSLENGATLRVGIGMAVLGPNEQDAGAGDAGPEDAGLDAGDEPELEGPRHFNLAAPAGESFVLHAPEVPVAVAFEFAKKCPGNAEVELIGQRQRARGRGRAALSLAVGVRSYSVRCIGKDGSLGRVVAHGTVQVLKDPGTRKLPPKPPASFVEADGRTYTIYYQNQLPDISVRWPNAPEEASYELEVDGKREIVASAEQLLKSGALRDGIHQLSFHGKTRRSRTTTIAVRFDNEAPTASLNEPSDRGFGPGSEVKVAGVALPTWKVSLEGGTIAKLSDGRFEGTIASTPDKPDIVVRLAHPRLGTHYYLRRAASSP